MNYQVFAFLIVFPVSMVVQQVTISPAQSQETSPGTSDTSPDGQNNALDKKPEAKFKLLTKEQSSEILIQKAQEKFEECIEKHKKNGTLNLFTSNLCKPVVELQPADNYTAQESPWNDFRIFRNFELLLEREGRV
ncbi:hypothetical protein [Roseibium marinum]|nr:hypothetical protein [Roseibium marinum]